ncbi:hypothetical protein OUZ56_019878 [Daphnia magna]|uniref:Uncharacterized protein n=1 Tax=Daphnia magna TaxID=35525 RepID=A0ABQ9ZCW5_9CRUS|nr:hypothetical protein OUZ56_019878 [Daphnia magna]
MPDFPASFLSFSMREKMKKKKKKKTNYLGVFGASSTQRRLLNNLKTRSSRSMFVYFSFCWLMSHVSNQKSKGENNKKNGRKSFNIQRPIFPNHFRYILQFRPINLKIKIDFTL